jgi:hypothetical protein
MQIRSPELFQKLETLAGHYKSNVASPYIKGEFPNLTLSRRDWDEIEMITARQEIFRHQGYHLDELYLKLLALARFVKQARTQWGTNLKNLVSIRYSTRPSSEKLMAEMVAANFLPNLKVLAEMVLEIFYMIRKEDGDQNQGKFKALSSVPEAKEIETLLQPG